MPVLISRVSSPRFPPQLCSPSHRRRPGGPTIPAVRSRAMAHIHQKIVIIGGGIAGLCTAVYARRCGYQVEVLEMHDTAGGLATSWRRGGYVFETCLHWLLGSNPKSAMHAQWADVCDIDSLTFIDSPEFQRIETERGESLSIYTNIDRLEAEMLRISPRDATRIRRFPADGRRIARFKLPAPATGLAGNWRAYLHDIPYLPLLHRLSHTDRKSTRLNSSHLGISY